jgi:hypothetical protein
MDIGATDRGRMHFDQHLIGLDLWNINLNQIEPGFFPDLLNCSH